jgi:sec-independent protein translocase protein TatA
LEVFFIFIPLILDVNLHYAEDKLFSIYADQIFFMNSLFILLGVLGTQEIIIIAIIILIFFGGRKIPELMRGVGKGIREFNDAKNSVRKEIEEGAADSKK